MANFVVRPVWRLDTPGTIVPAGTTIRPRGMRWIGATNAGHICEVRDAAGRTVWKSEATGANFKDADAPTFTMNDDAPRRPDEARRGQPHLPSETRRA